MTTRFRPRFLLTLAAVALVTVAITSAQAAPITVSAYTYGANSESQPQSNFVTLLDPGNVQLTDGVIATSWNTDPNVGFRNDSDNGQPQPRITFDLGGPFSVAAVDIWSLDAFGNPDESVSISSSTDGVTFSAPVTVDPIAWNSSGNGDRTVSVDVSALPDGQFLQVDVFDPNQWLMLSELQFDGTAATTGGGAVVPEPASIAIWSLLGLCLAGYGYRRRRNS